MEVAAGQNCTGGESRSTFFQIINCSVDIQTNPCATWRGSAALQKFWSTETPATGYLRMSNPKRSTSLHDAPQPDPACPTSICSIKPQSFRSGDQPLQTLLEPHLPPSTVILSFSMARKIANAPNPQRRYVIFEL